MTKYRISDEQYSETIDAANIDEAIEQAEESWQGGSWDGRCVISVRVAELDESGEESGEVAWVDVECGDDEPEPDCDAEAGHDWRSPHGVVGGIDSNPGVWSTGGTTIVTRECCVNCGMYRRSTAYGAQRNPGQCDTVEYLPADEASVAWIDSISAECE